MNFSSYIKNILKSQELDSQVSEILNFFTPLTLTKNSFLVEKDTICKYFCFIESGILQHAINILEEEKTTYLALKNSCTSALKSFLQETPSRKNIKALSDCNLQVILVKDFKYLLENNTAFHRFYYTLIEKQIFLIDDYRIDLLTLSAEERYTKLLTNEAELLQEVPLHYLASFLGISNRHMSRIRKNIK
ncbi:Crp/Fnr family transcriptional regulator [Tenacibaculum sp. AHE15PA]|uniref:Crp/Fnr family transcriptional regulator n=1 Tax=Tenacibaculum sp. AHE14PA TaxID=2745565 RepID=UPI001C4E60FC|nr:Crp/Fnr family transcriptional regulator [Tenacibaculum sp. AHE14PA]QXP73202.1 Crp/Fnr family transcriptional regulator [Tenacibaculum sp. AHE14PA]QXP77115.1 Crp/Fnr family transcriptional regulator [Tenacibaculum sp. AHE15PA]